MRRVRTALIERLVRAGWTDVEIARRTGLSPRVVRKIRLQEGLRRPGQDE